MKKSASSMGDGHYQSDGSLTPTTSQQPAGNNDGSATTTDDPSLTVNVNSSHTSHRAQDSTASTRFSSIPPSYDDDASTLAPESTYAPSTINGYAPSSIVENTSLLPHQRQRFASAPGQLQKTKGRKAFVYMCDAVDLLIPVDVNDEATSMRESSLGKVALAMHEMTGKRRSASTVPRGEWNRNEWSRQVGSDGIRTQR